MSSNQHIGVIESPRYAQTRARLIEDPIVQDMARTMITDLGVAGALERIGVTDDDIPFGFMNGALREYDHRGGTQPTHIGGVAEAIVAIIRDSLPRRVSDLDQHSLIEHLRQLLDASPERRGLELTATLHPAFDPDGAAPDEGAFLVRLSDHDDRFRVASVEVRVTWAEENCSHENTRPRPAGDGRECVDCGAEPEPEDEQQHCPDCRVVVTDHVSYFGVHHADCGYWDERCHRCHRLIPAGTASPTRSDLCRQCPDPELAGQDPT